MRLALAHQNDWTYSEQLDNAAWTKTNSSISANATTAPNGTSTADKLVENSDTGQQHRIERDLTGAADNTMQSVGAFVKAAERTWVMFRVDDKAGTQYQTRLNLSTGAVNLGDQDNVTDCGDGWYWIKQTFDASSGGGTANLRIITSDGTTQALNGDGSSGIYIWGIQWAKDSATLGGYASTTSAAFTGALAGTPKNGSTITWDAEGGVSRADLIMREESLSVSHGQTVVIDSLGTTQFVGNVVDIDYTGVIRPGVIDYKITCLDYVHRMGTTEVGSGSGAVYNNESDRDVVIDLASPLSSIISATTSTVDEILSSIKQAFSSDTMVREALDIVTNRAGARWSLDPNVAPAAVVALHYNSEANAGDADWDVSDSPNDSTTFDVENLTARHIFDDPGNDIVVVGGVDTFGRQIVSTGTDATSISTYGTKRKRFSSPNITTQDQADEVRDAILSKHKDPYWVSGYGTKRDGLKVNQLQDITHSGYGLSAETLFIRNIRAQQITNEKTYYSVSLGPDYSSEDKILRQLGTLSNGTNSTPLLLRGVYVDGNESYSRHNSSESTDESIYQDASNGLTVSYWVLRGSNLTGDDRGTFTATSSSFAASDGYFIGLDSSERVKLRSGGESWTGPTIPDDGQWHHVCIAWNGNYGASDVKMYLDGTDSSVGNSGSGSWSLNSGSHLNVIGPITDWGFSQIAAWSIQLKDGDIQRLAARPDANIPSTIFTQHRIGFWRMDEFADGSNISAGATAQLQDQWNDFHLDTNVTTSGNYGEGYETHWNPLLS